MARMREHSRVVFSQVEKVRALPPDARVLEVGSGAHGLIFFFPGLVRVGVDPVAVEYAPMFPRWQREAQTCAAFGEHLPFADGSFDVVLCDNVIDHAEGPAQIVRELARVLKRGGVLYFTVNVHHPVYHAASILHGVWTAAGLPFEIQPFANHTVHLTPDRAREIIRSVPVRIVIERNFIDDARSEARVKPARHLGDRLKRLFFKNALYEVVAIREGSI
jgi:SAM-dependent methyltransferase